MLNFNDGTTSVPEIAVLLVIALSMVTSLCLNPLVLMYNRNRRSRSIANYIFQVLSIVDLVTCIVLPVHVLAVAGQSDAQPANMPDKYQCTDENAWNCVALSVSTSMKLQSVLVLALILASLIVTGVMAICRWIQITYPFRRISRRLVAGALASSILASVMIQTFSLFQSTYPTVWIVQIMAAWAENPFNFPQTMKNYHRLLQILTVFSVALIFQVFALATSVHTIVGLVHYRKKINKVSKCNNSITRRGSIKILVTNFGSVLFIVSQMGGLIMQEHAQKLQLGPETVTIYSKTEAWTNFIFGYITSISLSAFNPVIFFVFTQNAFISMVLRVVSLNRVYSSRNTI